MVVQADTIVRDKIFAKLKRGLTSVIGEEDTPKLSVLDFGSGPRGYVLDWKGMFKQAFATDIRDFSAAYDGTGVTFVQSDGETVALPDQSIDVIVSHSVLEHVHDLDLILTDMNRMLNTGGLAYLTVAPLYYSATGLHRKSVLKNWEHLDPAHPSYLADTPFYDRRVKGETDMTGSPLNKMIVSDFLFAVGKQPWEIVSFKRQFVKQDLPGWIDRVEHDDLDLRTKGFTFVGRKLAFG